MFGCSLGDPRMKCPSLWLSTGGPRLRRLVYPGCRKNQICDSDLTQMIPINHNNVKPRYGSCIGGLAELWVSRIVFARGVSLEALARVDSIRFDLNKI